MQKSLEDLKKFWLEYFPDGSENSFHFHKKDEISPEEHITGLKSFQNYIDSDYFNKPDAKSKSKFHLDFIPQPFAGDLEKASIYILMLNPGFTHISYHSEENKDYRQELKNTLKQDFKGADYPFMWLNPKFAWTGGGAYWQKKLKTHIESFNGSRTEALKEVSEKIAVLQLIPYSSEVSPNLSKLEELESSSLVKSFVVNYVVPKVKKDNAAMIVTRQAKKWGFGEDSELIDKNIEVLQGPYVRSAHVAYSKDSTNKAGILINEFLNRN